MKDRCVCGCGRRGRHDHHVVYRQELRWRAAEASGRKLRKWSGDRRNIVRVDFDCHLAHHNGSRRLPLSVLPDSVFVFAVELMGAGAAYEYLRRRYDGGDPRLDALLEVA